MTLSPGTRLGAYEIVALIGAGGMGEVYHARDTRLNRDVALKVLPELFAADPDRLARFKREAQLLASLNHPNIAAIHGFEEHGPSTGSGRAVQALVPEQARGKAVDKRSDIWAFGCVLYEMLTGRRPFEGEDVTDVLARVIERPLDFTLLPRATPPARLIRRCLEKDAKRRLRDIGEARIEIEALERDPQRGMRQTPTASTNSELPRPQINVVVNWFEELRRLAPAN